MKIFSNKIILPVVILLAAIILGGAIYGAQINKQHSLEKQRQQKVEDDKLALEKEKINQSFGNNIKCQTLLKDLRDRWNNIIGIYYSSEKNTCIVKYTIKDGSTEEAPIEEMHDN